MQFKTKYLFALIPLAIALVLIYYFLDICTYIVLAWVFSMVGAPVMALFMKIFSRSTSAVLTLLTFAFIFSLIIGLFIPPLFQQAKNLSGVDYAKVVESFDEPIEDWKNWLAGKGLIAAEKNNGDFSQLDSKLDSDQLDLIRIDTTIMSEDSTGTKISLLININQPDSDQNEAQNDESFFKSYQRNIYKALDPSSIPRIFSSVVGFLGNVLITIMSIFFIAFFFLREQGLFSNMLSSVIPNVYETRLNKTLEESSKLLIRYFVGVAIQVFVITIFVSLALSIFGIKNALLIAFFAALINVIPYLGPIMGASFGTLITISSNLNLDFYSDLIPQLLIIMVVFFMVQMIDNFILQPTIFSKSVKAHPLEIFIIVLIGAKVGGIVGMIVAIPSYTVLRVVAKVFLGEFKVVQKITQDL